jgi:hypothetical protein
MDADGQRVAALSTCGGTCFIDKKSSAEHQEAICSMYKWYENARVCYERLSRLKNSCATAISVQVVQGRLDSV